MEDNKTIIALKALEKEINNFNERLYEIPEIDGYYSDLIKDMQSNEKMSKKERKALALKTLKERMPKIYALLSEIDLISEALESRIREIHDEVEEREQEVREIEDMKEEIENKIADLQ